MTVQEAYQRGNNLVTVSILGLAGFAFAPEILLEDELLHKVDDALLLLVGLAAIYWFRRGSNRYNRSVKPVILALAALVIKFSAVLIEMKDKPDVGDDMGGLILFVLAFIFIWWLYNRRQTPTESGSVSSQP